MSYFPHIDTLRDADRERSPCRYASTFAAFRFPDGFLEAADEDDRTVEHLEGIKARQGWDAYVAAASAVDGYGLTWPPGAGRAWRFDSTMPVRQRHRRPFHFASVVAPRLRAASRSLDRE
jgi:hypothetical protein